jgi:hypothetical protein
VRIRFEGPRSFDFICRSRSNFDITFPGRIVTNDNKIALRVILWLRPILRQISKLWHRVVNRQKVIKGRSFFWCFLNVERLEGIRQSGCTKQRNDGKTANRSHKFHFFSSFCLSFSTGAKRSPIFSTRARVLSERNFISVRER